MTERNSHIQFWDAIFPVGGIRRYFNRNEEDLKFYSSEDMSKDEIVEALKWEANQRYLQQLQINSLKYKK